MKINWGPGRTRADFVRQGKQSAQSGFTKDSDGVYHMPAFGCRPSWQSRAFAEGFRDECQKLGVRVNSRAFPN